MGTNTVLVTREKFFRVPRDRTASQTTFTATHGRCCLAFPIVGVARIVRYPST